MLGNVVTQKRRSKRTKKQALASNNNSILSVAPAASKRKTKKILEEFAQNNQKITDFFPVRRSSRKTGKQLEEEEHNALEDAIQSGCNEKLLEVYKCEIKGRGIKAAAPFSRNEFVVEYKGDMIDYNEAKMRESEYAKNPSIGSYMYFFKYKNTKWCIDATEESPFKGRLINHSALRPNLKTKVVEFDGHHHLILVAKRDIDEGEELLYDYGDRTAETIAHSPWLVNS